MPGWAEDNREKVRVTGSLVRILNTYLREKEDIWSMLYTYCRMMHGTYNIKMRNLLEYFNIKTSVLSFLFITHYTERKQQVYRTLIS